jgi:hypothetical protein
MRLDGFLIFSTGSGKWTMPCQILYIRCTNIMRVLFCMSFHWRSPPPPYTPKTIVVLLFTSSIFKGYFVLLLKYVLLPVLFTLIQVVLLLITSTFTRVQIQSNLGTTGCSGHTAFTFVKQKCLFRLRRKTIPLYLKLQFV